MQTWSEHDLRLKPACSYRSRVCFISLILYQSVQTFYGDREQHCISIVVVVFFNASFLKSRCLLMFIYPVEYQGLKKMFDVFNFRILEALYLSISAAFPI